jgi:hypothetical protein
MTNEIAPQNAIPDYLKNERGIELENIGNEDLATPLLLLLQALSPQVEESLGRAGEFFHSGAEVVLGSSITITPVFVTKAYTLWRPRPEGGVLARSFDGKNWDQTGEWEVKIKGVEKPVKWSIKTLDVKESGLAEWGSSNPADKDSKPAATLSYNIAVLIGGHFNLGPAVLQLQRSQIKPAKKLLGRFKVLTVPYYSLSIPLDQFKDSSNDGPFFNVRFGKFGWLNEDAFRIAKSFYEGFKTQGVKVRDMPHTDIPETEESEEY